MKALFLVFTAVLMSAPAMATETMISCTPSEKTQQEAVRTIPIYSVYAGRSFGSDIINGQLSMRYKNETEDRFMMSNQMNVGASLVDGRCEVTFAFQRNGFGAECASASACEAYEKMYVTVKVPGYADEGQLLEGEFNYLTKKVPNALFESQKELAKPNRGMTCFANIEYVQGLCDEAKKSSTRSSSANR